MAAILKYLISFVNTLLSFFLRAYGTNQRQRVDRYITLSLHLINYTPRRNIENKRCRH